MAVTKKVLERVQLFNGLSETELEAVSAICTRRDVAAGEQILEQGTMGTEMFIVSEGAVEVFIRGVESDRSLVVLGRGQMFGELALIDQGYRSASVRATREGAKLYAIESGQFYQLCQDNYRIGYVAMRNLAVDVAFKLRHRNLADL
jgi:CRP/FNR family transcriptional regulator